MIKINKLNTPVPNILLTDGATAKADMEAAYTASPNNYISSPGDPTTKFVFDSNIYGSEEVKTALTGLQNQKCCFCESKMRHVSDGDVEHFRPKGRWKQVNGTPINYPGYYWKAYDWDNLFLACQKCNQRNKQDLFPIEAGSTRAVNHVSDLNLESPTFLHPVDDDPEDHIEFIDQYIRQKNASDRGRITIEELGLDRDFLNEFREEKLDDLRALEDSYLSSIGHPNEQRCQDNFFDRLRHYVSEGGEYSNMFKCNFRLYLGEL